MKHKHRWPRLPLPTLLTLVAAVCAACGLIGSELTTFKFDLPEKQYSFDSADANRWKVPAGGVPLVACASQDDCCRPGGVDCAEYPIGCETGSCTLSLRVDLVQSVNLGMEAPELRELQGQMVADISLESLSYRIDSNNLSVDLPPVDIYLAPATVTSISDPAAQKLGTMPAIPAGRSGEGMVQLVPNHKAVFRQYAKNIADPFNILTTATLKVGGGPSPTGAIRMTIWGTAEVQFDPL